MHRSILHTHGTPSENRIYLDHNATTPVEQEVIDEMLPFFLKEFGNAASAHHRFGENANAVVEESRALVAQLVGGKPEEIYFTSGATESNNLAIKGVAAPNSPKCHIILSSVEHDSVLRSVQFTETLGHECTLVGVDRHGLVSPEAISREMRPHTRLVSVMVANNEIGSINPVAEIGLLCRQREILFHSDGAQAVGKIPIDVTSTYIDMLSVSAHKMYGPKGIGALFVRAGCCGNLQPLLHGGGQERGLRSGTLAVPLIVGFGLAAKRRKQYMGEEQAHLQDLGERLLTGLRHRISNMVLNGPEVNRLPGNINVSFPGVPSEALLMGLLDIVALSSGSACASQHSNDSHVLRAVGASRGVIESSIRIGIGRTNTANEIDTVLDAIVDSVARLRRIHDHCVS